jgi:hypothetical protein
MVGVSVGVSDGVGVSVGVGVIVGVEETVGVSVTVGVRVTVGDTVRVGVRVAVLDPVGVIVGVIVRVRVTVGVSVRVGVAEPVGVLVAEGVKDADGAGEAVSVHVDGKLAVAPGVELGCVALGKGVGPLVPNTSSMAWPTIGSWTPRTACTPTAKVQKAMAINVGPTSRARISLLSLEPLRLHSDPDG